MRTAYETLIGGPTSKHHEHSALAIIDEVRKPLSLAWKHILYAPVSATFTSTALVSPSLIATVSAGVAPLLGKKSYA